LQGRDGRSSPRPAPPRPAADALAAELVRRGGEPASATLLADVGIAIFRTGFSRRADNPDGDDLVLCLREAGVVLADAVGTFCAA
jgi:hypothetical protein